MSFRRVAILAAVRNDSDDRPLGGLGVGWANKWHASSLLSLAADMSYLMRNGYLTLCRTELWKTSPWERELPLMLGIVDRKERSWLIREGGWRGKFMEDMQVHNGCVDGDGRLYGELLSVFGMKPRMAERRVADVVATYRVFNQYLVDAVAELGREGDVEIDSSVFSLQQLRDPDWVFSPVRVEEVALSALLSRDRSEAQRELTGRALAALAKEAANQSDGPVSLAAQALLGNTPLFDREYLLTHRKDDNATT